MDLMREKAALEAEIQVILDYEEEERKRREALRKKRSVSKRSCFSCCYYLDLNKKSVVFLENSEHGDGRVRAEDRGVGRG